MLLQSAIEEIISPEDVSRLGKTLFVFVDDAPSTHMYLTGNWKNRVVVMQICDIPHDFSTIKRSEWLWSTTNKSLCRYKHTRGVNTLGQTIVVIILPDGITEKWASIHHLRRMSVYRVCDVEP